MNTFIVIILTLAIPFLIGLFEKKVKIIEWLSPVVSCYAMGIILGNIPGINWDTSIARTISEVSLMFALPMLLFATDFPAWFKLAKTTIISFALLIVCVMSVSFVVGSLFKGYDPEVWKMAGMLTGVYIGGTANLTAIGKMLEVRDDIFITLNAVDVAIGGVYLLIVMSVGVKLLTLFLRPFDRSNAQEEEVDFLNWRKLSFSKKSRNALLLILLSGASVGAALFFSKIITGEESATIIILGLTFISLGLSFFQKIRHFEGSQECGNYFLLVFCVAVGSLANVSELMTGKTWYFVFCSLIMFISILLHFLCCFFLKIDRDTAIITSMAGIFGPAFVAPMSGVLKNKAILVSGVTTGLVGIALGNFAGLTVSWLLK